MAVMRLLYLFALITYANAAVTVTIVSFSTSWPQNVTLIATIKPKPATPYAKVNFFDDNTRISPVGGVTVTELLDGSGVQATFRYDVKKGPKTGVVSRPIKATYAAQTSPVVQLKVWPGQIAVTLNFNKATYRLGEIVTATTTVKVLRRPHPDGFKPGKKQVIFRSQATNQNVACIGGVKFTKTTTGATYVCTFAASGRIGEEKFWAIYKGDNAYYGGATQTNEKKITKICAVGFADCNGDNLCETNTNTNINHCGGCNQPCDLVNSDFQCTSAVCKIKTCDFDFFNCDNNDDSGCEYHCAAEHPVTEDVDVVLDEYPADTQCVYRQDKLKTGEIPRQGGNTNEHWVRVKRGGVELALRLEERTLGVYTPVGGKSKIYETIACRSAGSTGSDKARWNYGLSVDLRGGTGSFANKKFKDFDIKLTIDIAAGSATPTDLSATATFPYVIDVEDLFGAGLIYDTCTCGSTSNPKVSTFPVGYTINGQTPQGTDCLVIAEAFKGELFFLQESTNIRFQLPDWDFTKDAFLNLTLSLTPKVSAGANVCTGAICSLSTNIYALIKKTVCPSGNN